MAPKAATSAEVDPAGRAWLAGDHHVHSWYSAGWKPSADGKAAPLPVKGGDFNHPITTNAKMAASTVWRGWSRPTTAARTIRSSTASSPIPRCCRRADTKVLLVFFGMELDTPAAEHSSVIVPHTPPERDALFGIESGYNAANPCPATRPATLRSA